MAKNFKIADIDRNAIYTVSTIDNWGVLSWNTEADFMKSAAACF